MIAIRRARTRYLFPLAVLLPMSVWYVIFLYYPTIYSLWASLHLWVAENPSKSTFIGMRNYVALFTADPRFQKALVNTFLYIAVKVAIVVPIGMIIALLLEKLRHGTKLYVFAIFLPALCSATAIGILFNYLYQPSFGLFNAILKQVRLPSQPFLSSAAQAIYCVILTDSWQYMGFTTLIFYTGLMSLPEVFAEAARVDGAGPLRTFFQVKTADPRPHGDVHHGLHHHQRFPVIRFHLRDDVLRWRDGRSIRRARLFQLRPQPPGVHRRDAEDAHRHIHDGCNGAAGDRAGTDACPASAPSAEMGILRREYGRAISPAAVAADRPGGDPRCAHSRLRPVRAAVSLHVSRAHSNRPWRSSRCRRASSRRSSP